LSGLGAGEWHGGPRPLPGPDAARLACLTPLAAAVSARPEVRLGAALATAALGWCAAADDAAERGIVCPDRWSPARRRVWQGGACLRVTAWPRPAGTGWRAPAVLMAGAFPEVDGHPGPRPGEGVMIAGEGAGPHLWQRLAGQLDCRVPRRAAVPGGFSTRDFLRGRGLAWEGRLTERDTLPAQDDILGHAGARWLSPLRVSLVDRIETLFPPDEARLLRSVLLGDRSEEMRSLRASYAGLGLGHLFAVSGLHVGLVGGILMLMLRLARLGPGGRCLILVPALVVYTLLVGMPGSAVRAASLLGVAAVAAWTGRPPDGLRSLGLLLWIWTLAEPAALSDAGLRLSFGAAAGIVLTLRAVSPGLAGRPRAVRWLGNALAVSLGAQLGALPETARSFGWIHPLATGLNLVAVPVFGGAVWLGAGALLLAPLGWLAESLSAVSWLMLRLISAGTGLLADLAGARLGLPLWDLRAGVLYATGLWGLWRLATASGRVARCVGAVCAAGLLTLPYLGRTVHGGEMTAVQFDVGQGDCAALVFPDRSWILIDTGEAWRDTGPFRRDVRPWLRREGLGPPAGVVLTHGHADHDGAAAQVAAELAPSTWWLGGRAEAPPDVHPRSVRRPAPGDTLHRAAGWSLICIATGGAEKTGPAENDRSLVVALHGHGRPRGLWTGDLEAAGERDLLARHPIHAPHGLEVLKAGHHGSRTSSSPGFLAALRPATMLISCGLDNRHGHPSHGPFTLGVDTLRVLRTDLDGTVVLRWRDAGPPEITAGPVPAAIGLTPGGPARTMPASRR